MTTKITANSPVETNDNVEPIADEEDKLLVASWYDLVSILISTQVISLGYLNQHFNGVIVTMLILSRSVSKHGRHLGNSRFWFVDF
jgi:hypothetical protein